MWYNTELLKFRISLLNLYYCLAVMGYYASKK